MPQRIIIAVAAVTALLVLPAAPAFAHGGGGSDASNFASTINGLATLDGKGNPAGPPVDPPDVEWRVLANDALLQVTNRSGQELAVPGYSGEPYLRVGPEVVWVNRNSPAYYLNSDRYAQASVPEGVSAEAEPDWVKVSSKPVSAWHDHRIHWMSPALPPQVVATRAEQAVTVNDWVVPFTIGSRQLAVTGQLRWFPPTPWWPWLLAGLAVTGLPLVTALRRPAGAGRRLALIRAGAVVLGVLAAVDVVHAVDDVLAVPLGFTQNALAFLQSTLSIAIAGWGAYRGWRGDDGAPAALAIGAGALAVGSGLTHLPTLVSSQVATVLPVWFSRAVIAANLAVAASVGFAVWRGREPLPAPLPPGDEPTPATGDVP
ncbi:MAG: hypothetical protein ACRDYX_14695 [Egibacteraceae bacterium]